MVGGISITCADHRWLLMLSIAEWVSMDNRCYDMWCHLLERRHVCCLFCLFVMLFCCFTLGGVGISGGIICNLLSDWLGGGGVMLSFSGVAAFMGGAVGATMTGGVVTLGKDGATLGGETVCCCGAIVGTCCCGWNMAH